MSLRGHLALARGQNHAAALIATLLLMLLVGPALGQEDVSYTQRGVPAEATAENAVIARERAFTSGRRAAWERVASAAGITRSLSDSQIEGMVSSIIIEEERTTPTRYAGRITVNFNPARVRSLTGAESADGNDAGPQDMQAAADPRPAAAMPAVATIDAIAIYGSLNEWLELRRRLRGSVARLDVVAISTDRARLRLGLRAPPAAAAEDLARQGLTFIPGSGAPGDAWRVGLAGRS